MKSIKKLAEFIEKSNVLFESMTTEEKKVQVAKDCIKRIELEQLQPTQGALVGFNTINAIQKRARQLSSLKDIINNEEYPICQVCAKGGLFMSYVGRVNEFSAKLLTNDSKNEYNTVNDVEHKKLLEIFTARELAYIEFGFETRQCLNYDTEGNRIQFTSKEIERVNNFKAKYETAERRLLEICKNIIRNKGTFKLSKHYDTKNTNKVCRY